MIGKTESQRSVIVPPFSLATAGHIFFAAASGAGKTTISTSVIAGELAASLDGPADARPSVLVVDPKTDHVEALLARLAFVAPDLLRCSVHYLNPFVPGGGFPFNVAHLAGSADVRAEQLAMLVAEVSTARGSDRAMGLGARQVDALYHLFLACLDSDHSGRTPLWVLDALQLKDGAERLARATRSERARRFLRGPKMGEELVASLSSRVRSALSATSDLERVMGASSCVSFTELLGRPGQVVLVDLGGPPGGLRSLQVLWANLIVRLAVESLLERPCPFHGHGVRLVLEEAQLLAPIADLGQVLLETGRARRVALSILTQSTTAIESISRPWFAAIMANCPTKIVGRVATPDAVLFSRGLAPHLGEEAIRDVQERLAVTIANLPNRAFLALSPGGRQRFVSTPLDEPAVADAVLREAGAIVALKRRYVLPRHARVLLGDVETESSERDTPRAARSPWDER